MSISSVWICKSEYTTVLYEMARAEKQYTDNQNQSLVSRIISTYYNIRSTAKFRKISSAILNDVMW